MSNWALTAADVSDLSDGCALLGSGGGGDTHALGLALRARLESSGSLVVLDPDAVADDALVVNVGFVGAPITMTEKLFCESEIVTAIDAMQRKLGRSVDAVMPAEIGGANGVTAFVAGALMGVPVVDADGMGRAFPMSDQITYSIYGRTASPTMVTTEQGDVVCVEGCSNRRVEQIVRAVAAAAGHKCFTVDYVLSGRDVRECAVLGSASLARRLGATLRAARKDHRDPVQALRQAMVDSGGPGLRLLFEGKVVECSNDTRGGFGYGTVRVESVPAGSTLTLNFQNEFLIASVNGEAVATTPDIISLADADTLRSIGSEGVRYGQRVKVVVIQAPRLMTTSAALAVVGPRAFGFDLDYRPMGSAA